MAYQHCYKAIAYRWHFPPKLVELPDGRVIDATPAPGCTYTRDTWPPRGRGRGESLYSPRRMEAKLRAQKVLQMRIEGYTWEAIAQNLGFKDRSGPWRAVRRTFDRFDRNRIQKQKLARLACVTSPLV